MSLWDVQAFTDHWVWWTLSVACVVWYSTITVYVAIRGAFDIRGMLRRLAADAAETPSPQPGQTPKEPGGCTKGQAPR